jgi:hypothetical protein
MFIHNINEFVLDFLRTNINKTNTEDIWLSKKNQQSLVKTLKKNNVKIKDPDKPKRGKSAFLFFCEVNRKILKEKYPDMSVKEIVSKLGVDWQILKDTNSCEIENYEAMSIKDRNRYKQQMRSYIPILNRKIYNNEENKESDKKQSKRRSKRNKEEIMYENFLKSKKTRTKKLHPEFESKDLIDFLKNKWETMKDEKKLKYYKSKRKTKET